MTTTTTTNSYRIEQGLFRDIVGRYASGITVITGQDDSGPAVFTCQSFYSVSIDPPLVSFSVMKTSTTYPRIRDTGRFAVNFLSRGQKTVSSQFARKGNDKWANIQWTPSKEGNPPSLTAPLPGLTAASGPSMMPPTTSSSSDESSNSERARTPFPIRFCTSKGSTGRCCGLRHTTSTHQGRARHRGAHPAAGLASSTGCSISNPTTMIPRQAPGSEKESS
jgi:Flavin reductase like domain